jgi:DNA-directed RNA polymerase I and III subunit RPAC1
MANTLRRIMIADVPTMAIEHVYVIDNTSIIQDEVLAHRLGLIPLAVDPRLFEFRADDEPASESNTIVLKLKVECKQLPDGTIENEKVYSSQLVWLPTGSEMPGETGAQPWANSQSEMLEAVRPMHDDILIAKLRPGQAIEVECHCVKGVGEDHAKFSPVATTWYRLVPEVALLEEPSAEVAAALAAELPGLVRVAPGGGVEIDDARRHGKLLEKARRMSGEPEWAPYLQLRKRKDHFIFTIESTGAWRPHELFKEAVARIVSKCDKVLEGLASFPEKSFDY